MDDSSVGTWLKTARTEKDLSIEQVFNDTYISVRLIEALENEHYHEFTSEVYIVGFLKSYAEYLGIDSDQIVQLFRSMRMQEQPTPIAELLKKESRLKKPMLIILASLVTVAGLALIIGRIFFPDYAAEVISLREQNIRVNDSDRGVSNLTTETSAVYALDNGFLEREFRVGDTIDLSTNQQLYFLVVKSVARFVRLESIDRQFKVKLENNERVIIVIDRERDVRAELLVRNIIRDRKPPVAVLRVRTRTEDVAVTARSGSVDAVDEQQREVAIVYGNTTVASRKRASIDLGVRDVSPIFPVQFTFTATAFLQYQVDNESRVSRLYGDGDTIELAPRQRLSAWVTNAGAVVFQVANRFVPVGESGEVASFTIEKSFDAAANKDTLRIIPLY